MKSSDIPKGSSIGEAFRETPSSIMDKARGKLLVRTLAQTMAFYISGDISKNKSNFDPAIVSKFEAVDYSKKCSLEWQL